MFNLNGNKFNIIYFLINLKNLLNNLAFTIVICSILLKVSTLIYILSVSLYVSSIKVKFRHYINLQNNINLLITVIQMKFTQFRSFKIISSQNSYLIKFNIKLQFYSCNRIFPALFVLLSIFIIYIITEIQISFCQMPPLLNMCPSLFCKQ